MAKRPYILSVAGIDPSGGAGLLADIKTFEQLETYGLGIPTANTIQTANDFFANQWLPSSYIIEGVKRMLAAYPVAAVKIGIIQSSELLEEITDVIRRNYADKIKIVWDPVLKSSTNHEFQSRWSLSPTLLNSIDVITPNQMEWDKMKNFLPETYAAAILLKGGHSADKPGYDYLSVDGKTIEIEPQTMQPVFEKHGSGCVYASALAAYLAKGNELTDACKNAKAYTENYLASTEEKLGHHNGKTSLHIAG